MNYLYLIIITLLLLLIIFKCYVKIKYKFWAKQPVFHPYNLWWWISPPGIIDSELPTTNKYCNFVNISTKEFEEHDNNTLVEIITFIKNYYYIQLSATYAPTVNNFSSYFIGSNKPLISTYYKSNTRLNDDMKLINDKELIALMTTRTVNITLKNTDVFLAHYVDYLCVHNSYRKQNIAPEIIKTHEYVQRHKKKKIVVSLFKRDGILTGIVPLTTYNTYQFDISSIKKMSLLYTTTQLIEINKLTIRLLTAFIYEQKHKLDCYILPDLSNLLNLINNNTYRIYGIMKNQVLIAAYFFKDSQMLYDIRTEKEREEETTEHQLLKSIDFFGSLNNCENDVFLRGFSLAVHKCNKKQKYKFITIENISNNNIIINNLFLLKIIPRIVSPTAYFYYNYAKKPILPEKVFVLC